MSEEITKPFNPGDMVSCSFPGCGKNKFTVARVCTANNCGSGFMVAAHLQGSPDREIRGTVIDGINYGIDAGWFTLIND